MHQRNFRQSSSGNMLFSSIHFISQMHQFRALGSFAYKAGRVSTMSRPRNASEVGVGLIKTSSYETPSEDIGTLHHMIIVCLLCELCDLP